MGNRSSKKKEDDASGGRRVNNKRSSFKGLSLCWLLFKNVVIVVVVVVYNGCIIAKTFSGRQCARRCLGMCLTSFRVL